MPPLRARKKNPSIAGHPVDSNKLRPSASSDMLIPIHRRPHAEEQNQHSRPHRAPFRRLRHNNSLALPAPRGKNLGMHTDIASVSDGRVVESDDPFDHLREVKNHLDDAVTSLSKALVAAPDVLHSNPLLNLPVIAESILKARTELSRF